LQVNWLYKAKIQNFIDRFPERLSYGFYYFLQRNFGGLKDPNPVSRLKAGVKIADLITSLGHSVKGKEFLEIGTGRRLNTPIALWLMGAGRIRTLDLNPYLRPELVKEDLQYLVTNKNEIFEIFKGFEIDKQRFQTLESLVTSGFDLHHLMRTCLIDYMAPGNAAKLYLPNASIDFQISHTVFEHIHPGVLHEILVEGNRIIKKSGLFVHRIDFSDHFSHSERSINAINFLQFSDFDWNKIAGNKYMYMNRLRLDDFQLLFENASQEILHTEVSENSDLLKGLQEQRFPLAAKFAKKSPKVLSTTGAWFVTKPCD